jgi:hypothetical protein
MYKPCPLVYFTKAPTLRYPITSHMRHIFTLRQKLLLFRTKEKLHLLAPLKKPTIYTFNFGHQHRLLQCNAQCQFAF